MTSIAKIISLIALSLVVVPCVLCFLNTIELDAVKWAALAGTIGWFVFTPIWMGRDSINNVAKTES